MIKDDIIRKQSSSVSEVIHKKASSPRSGLVHRVADKPEQNGTKPVPFQRRKSSKPTFPF
jgi:hypothetical protein